MQIYTVTTSLTVASQITDGIITKVKLATDSVQFIAAMALLGGD